MKFLDAIDAREVFVQDKNLQVDTSSVARVFEVYKILLHVPIDYMTRTARTDLGRRAMTFDAVILKAGGSAREIASVRTFMKRVWEWIGAVDHPVSDQVYSYCARLDESCSLSRSSWTICSAHVPLIPLMTL